MQILLIQSEIEQAIRDYMNQQINIKEGSTLEIDLRSTRGTEGFTANIDIRTGGTIKPVIPLVPPESTYRGEVEPVKSIAATAAATPTVVETQEESIDVPIEPKKSLFGGLKKITNETMIVE